MGNPNVPAPSYIKEAVLDIFDTVPTQKIHSYTVAPGNPEVREILAKDINRRFGTHFTKDNLFMTAGAAASISITFKALAEPGDEFVIVAPFFPEYRPFVEATGARLVVVPAQVEDFQINMDLFERALTRHTKGVIVNSPNNPSGAIYSEETIRALSALLLRKEKEYGHPIYIISDEPYREIAYHGYEVPYIPLYYKDTIVCYSYSKSFSLPGERIGYIVIPSEVTGFEKYILQFAERLGSSPMSMLPASGSLSWPAVQANQRMRNRIASTGNCFIRVLLVSVLPVYVRRGLFIFSRSAWKKMIMPSVNGP